MLPFRKLTPFFAAALIAPCISAPSQAAVGPAEGPMGSRFGLHLGAGYSAGLGNTAGTGIGFTWLAGLDYRLTPKLFFSADYQNFGGTSATSGSASASTGLMMYRANANYFLSEGFYAGVNAGVQVTSSSVTVLSVPISSAVASFSFGPQVGYTFDLTHGFSLAPEAALHINMSTPVSTWATGVVRLGYTF